MEQHSSQRGGVVHHQRAHRGVSFSRVRRSRQPRSAGLHFLHIALLPEGVVHWVCRTARKDQRCDKEHQGSEWLRFFRVSVLSFFPNCMSRAITLLNKQEDERTAAKGESESNAARSSKMPPHSRGFLASHHRIILHRSSDSIRFISTYLIRRKRIQAHPRSTAALCFPCVWIRRPRGSPWDCTSTCSYCLNSHGSHRQ